MQKKLKHPNKITHAYLKNFDPAAARTRIPLGDDLYCIVRAKNDSGSKSYVGKMRHPITKKWTEKTIGKVTEMKPAEAKEKWLVIKRQSKINKCHPNKLREDQKIKTLSEVKDEMFVMLKSKIKFLLDCVHRLILGLTFILITPIFFPPF